MSKHYHANDRLSADQFDAEELPIPVWAWSLAGVVILLVLIVR